MYLVDSFLFLFFSPFSTASSDIILDLACKLKKPNVGLVHQMPFVTDQKGFAATLEKVNTLVSCAIHGVFLNL